VGHLSACFVSGVPSASSWLELQARRVLEDAVVRDEGDVEAKRGGGDPAVGVMVALAEGMADVLAGDAQLGVGANQVVAGVDDLGAGDSCLEMAHARATPASKKGAVAQLGDSLKRQESGAADEERVVAPGQRRVRSETGTEYVGVDDDWPSVRTGQRRTAARKASASSGVRSSITISP